MTNQTEHPSPKQRASEARRLEKKRRKRELIIAGVAFGIVLILTYIQLTKLYAGDRLFMALFNINFIILIGILFVVIRNSYKLFLERRQRILGSGLRSRLTLAFVSLAMIPCLLMLFVTTKYVQLSMDFWFKEQIETSLDYALSVTSTAYQRTEQSLGTRSQAIEDTLLQTSLPLTSASVQHSLTTKRKEYNIDFVGLIHKDKSLISWSSADNSTEPYASARSELHLDNIALDGRESSLVPAFTGDYLFYITPLTYHDEVYLVLAENMGAGLSAKVERINKGVNEYKALRKVRRSLKGLLYISLAVLTGLITMAAIWLAFRLARDISAPILAVASGIKRIASGDLSIRLEDSPTDEMTTLVRSFNKMAQDLDTSRQEIVGFNYKLERQNLAIAQHNKYIETVLNNIDSGVISFDANGFITTMNKAASNMFQIPPEKAIGKKANDFVYATYVLRIETIQQQLRSKQKSRVQQSFVFPIGSEEKRILVTCVGFATDDIYSGCVAVFEDISEVERMQRLAAWREVARRIAHEIKNPLTPIKLSAERLAKKFGSGIEDPAFTQSTKLIISQVEQLQSMVQEFSAFAKLPEIKPVTSSITAVIRDSMELFTTSHPHINWQVTLPENLPTLLLDPEAMQRVFINLFTNAIEAFTLSKEEHPAVSVSVQWEQEMSFLHINVENNGAPVSEEIRSQMFDPYVSNKKGGTGLGLTIVRSIIADHHGYVRAHHREGGGIIITIELPVPQE